MSHEVEYDKSFDHYIVRQKGKYIGVVRKKDKGWLSVPRPKFPGQMLHKLPHKTKKDAVEHLLTYHGIEENTLIPFRRFKDHLC
jgi:hypothetical protein